MTLWALEVVGPQGSNALKPCSNRSAAIAHFEMTAPGLGNTIRLVKIDVGVTSVRMLCMWANRESFDSCPKTVSVVKTKGG